MKNKKIILGLFVPPRCQDKKINFNELNKIVGKSFIYASRGRHAIYKILKN